ncbi:MAG: glycosyltransferase family 2 protein [Bacteroidota bacterium]
MQSLDIILPCYNPEPHWAQNIVQEYERVRQAIPDLEHKLIIVNDGSSKGVEDLDVVHLKENIPNLEYLSYTQNQGKGYALRHGIAKSTADYSVFTDIDFPYESESLIHLFKTLQNGPDIVIGVRDESYYENVPKGRVRISKVFKFFLKNFFRLPVSDTQCGLKGFNAEGRVIFLESTMNRYLFDLEFIFLASRRRAIKLTSVPVKLKPGIVFSKKSMKILSQEGRSFLKIFVKSLFQPRK